MFSLFGYYLFSVTACSQYYLDRTLPNTCIIFAKPFFFTSRNKTKTFNHTAVVTHAQDTTASMLKYKIIFFL